MHEKIFAHLLLEIFLFVKWWLHSVDLTYIFGLHLQTPRLSALSLSYDVTYTSLGIKPRPLSLRLHLIYPSYVTNAHKFANFN